jgi:hypothetical protein
MNRHLSQQEGQFAMDAIQTAPDPTHVGQQDEALRRVIEQQIGPREPGIVYDNADGLFAVLAVTRDASEARRILKRRAAQFAVWVEDLITGDRYPTCAVWTGSDRVLKSVA